MRLAESAGVRRFRLVPGRRSRPDPKFFAGSGKAEEIGREADDLNASVVIFNHQLSASQQRNLEQKLERRVLDRTDLILEIFAQRARTSEGKLQVELAQLEHLSTRLVRGWTHLERQRGGLGATGGPGETQLELDRRLIGQRVRVLRTKLEKLRDRRTVQRRARSRREVLSVSIVGYTNSGKSTLFNALTHARAYAANQLFATLDTTTRRVWLKGESGGESGSAFGEESGGEPANEGLGVTLSDTVGFLRELPHGLVAAFRATLEETNQADLLLHVVDSASGARESQIEEVNRVLAEIGVADIRQIEVWNKIDASGLSPGIDRDEYGRISRLRISARTGAGLSELRGAIAEIAREHGPAARVRNTKPQNAKPEYSP